MGNSGSKRARGCVCGCVTCQRNRAHPQELRADDSHKAQTTSWLPPRENWTGTSGLPFGWETGLDKNDKDYFINHVDRYTTRDDPRQDPDYVEPPRPREVELVRDLEKGFGFVAGSERPVVVRFVTEGGPSEEKLLPGDQILKINGEEVRRAPREKVIELVRSCKESIVLTVCQPYTDNSSRKSALLTAAKKAKLKTNPSRVRFADAVMVNGASITNPSPVESYVPFMPNVLKVFLENGQTKSFKYDNKTTVKDVVVSLQEKLNIRCVNHFNLVLQNMKNNTGTAAKMTLLQEHETLAEIAARQGARYFRCLFRVTFVPKDAYDLLKEDPIAFEYFYLQCCNDVLHERFASEMKYDTALRLAALQIQQHAMSNNMGAKISIKAIIKECGLDKFVSKSLLESMKGKDLKRMLSQYLKMNQSLAAPGQKQLTALQAKLHYMKIVGELKTFGSRVFMVTLLDKKTEAMLLVGPHAGVSIVTNIKSYALTVLSDYEHLEQVKVTKDGDNMHRVDLRLKGQREDISLGLLSEDAQNFVCLVAGYYRIFVDPDRRLVERTIGKNTTDPDVPSFESVHRVLSAPWSYPEDLVSEMVGHPADSNGVSDNQRLVDLSQDPPEYEENEEYLARVKEDLGIQMGETSMTTAAERPKNISTINVVSPSSQQQYQHHQAQAPFTQFKMNGSASASATAITATATTSASSPFEEGVTSFGTASSDSSSRSSSFSSSAPLTGPGSPYHGLQPSPHPMLNTTIDLRRTIAAANGHSAMSPSAAVAAISGRNGGFVGGGGGGFSNSSSPSSSSPPPLPLSATVMFQQQQLLQLDGRGESSERSSDTDSVSTLDTTERRPLLGPPVAASAPSAAGGVSGGATAVSGGGGGSSVVTLNGGVVSIGGGGGGGGEAESDDTDSFGTPSGSPAKGRLIQRVSSVESGMHSFGLHSPDMVPPSDVDFQTMSDAEMSHLPPEVYNAIYNQQDPNSVIPPQRLYLDPDIIDLTIFPLPESATDDETMIDFTALPSLPPPSFANPPSTTPTSSSSVSSPTAAAAPGLPPASSLPSSYISHHPASPRRLATGSHTDFTNGYSSHVMLSHNDSSRTARPGLVRSASAGHSPDLFDSDIESLIAHYYVPPPPSSSTSVASASASGHVAGSQQSQQAALSQSFSGAIAGFPSSGPAQPSGMSPFHDDPGNDVLMDVDDFSSLIIPPPPSSTSPQTADDVTVVPPPAPPSTTASTAPSAAAAVAGEEEGAVKKRRQFRHKRSSSVDIGSLNLARQQLAEAEKRRSLDVDEDARKRKEGQELGRDVGGGGNSGSIRRSSPPHDLRGVSSATDYDSHDGLSAESPATVSLKLHNLLKSLPTIAPEVAMSNQPPAFHRTGSLRIPRSASLELVGPGAPGAARGAAPYGVVGGAGAAGGSGGQDAAQAFTGKPSLRTLFSGTSSLGRNSGRRAMSSEHLAPGASATGGGGGGSSSDSQQQQQHQQQSPTDSFASLKAKLKDYRDHLLKRANASSSSSSRKNSDSSGSEYSADGSKKKSSLRRSNSFSRLLSQLSGSVGGGRRGSKSSTSSEPVVVGDGNWTLRGRSPGRESDDGVSSSSTGDLQGLFGPPPGASEEEKRGGVAPQVRENLAVPRTSLRPVTTSGATQNKSKKSGPLKALSSVFASDEKASENELDDSHNLKSKHSTPNSKQPSLQKKTTASSSSVQRNNSGHYDSKDDLSMTQADGRKKKSKVQTNPYATIKMWRPITMTSSVSHDEEAYRSFTNFDALVVAGTATALEDQARLPATGDLRNEDYHAGDHPSALSRTVSHPVTADELAASSRNGADAISVAPDYPHATPPTSPRRGGYADSNGKSRTGVGKKVLQPKRSAPPIPPSSYSTQPEAARQRTVSPPPSSAVTIPVKTRTLSISEEQEPRSEATLVPPPRRSRQTSKSSSRASPSPSSSTPSSMNGGADVPADYPLPRSTSPAYVTDSSNDDTSRRSRSESRNSGGNSSTSSSGREHRADSSERRGRTVIESSCAVVNPDVAKSVKAVLSKTYYGGPDGFEAAAQDVESMLSRLKVTMETLKVAQARAAASSNASPSQFQTVRQELQLQTKQFVQDAKYLVAGATGTREAVSQHVNHAMHTLARVFLHSQSSMVRMHTVHQAQHVGFEVLKVSASFKSTVAAANAAIGKPTTDPHMKYLMRQATNLAGLLSTLLKTLKTLEQV